MVASAVHRRNTAIVAAALYLLTLPFLILVAVGNTHINTTLNDIYFFKIDVSQIIPISVANSRLLNSVARSLGLHDFYSVGLWNFCEGYHGEGVKFCSEPRQFYWFNPIDILVSELLAGATIALPAEVVTVLDLLRLGSRVMYAFFMSGTVVNLVLMLLSPLAMRSRWFSLGISILAAISTVLVAVASIIATAISVAIKIALSAQDEVDVRAEIGVKMFVFMWLATIFTTLAFMLHAAMGCCCKPERKAASSGHGESTVEVSETNKTRSHGLSLPSFVRRRKGAPGGEGSRGTISAE
ncbi:SUR7 family protein-like protein [Hapsidospora chrysogenum ATCC 11550]|uniref:SUR7 family protein-like protein n=1 Tax=Hapsidospora chrysogenum (strain ATCC 11550 / CBS 779.69 / DSM 880 / IAM 14645 / JCM 23072 / IMI 49137) TaxID=857340 RepID=A0A086T5Y1_HAPC1|nr:SUR7 family protein-like protein [Hapsidospora chrysogenum ATCC 11550]